MGSKVEDVNLQLPSNLLMLTYWCETSDTTLGSWIINMTFSRQLNLMSAYIVKMIDLLDSFQWSHLCPTVSQLRLKLLFKQRPSPVRCGWNTWQRHKEEDISKDTKDILYTWWCRYIYVYKHIIIIYIMEYEKYNCWNHFGFYQDFNL